MSDPVARPAAPLSERAAAILDFEKQWWSFPGTKEAEIRARFDLRFSATAMARRYLDVYADLLAQRPFAAPMRTIEEERSFAALA